MFKKFAHFKKKMNGIILKNMTPPTAIVTFFSIQIPTKKKKDTQNCSKKQASKMVQVKISQQ